MQQTRTAAPPSKPGAVNPPPPPASTPAPKRTRNVPMQHRLALAILAIHNIAHTQKLAPELSASIAAAYALVKDVNEKVIAPTRNRIAEVQKELQAAVADVSKIDAGKVKTLSQELNRLQNKLKTIQGPPKTT